MRTPNAFISYSWDDDLHKDWVKALASKLRGDGVDVTLDRWAFIPGGHRGLRGAGRSQSGGGDGEGSMNPRSASGRPLGAGRLGWGGL